MEIRDKVRAFLALGSNIGNREANLEHAILTLSSRAGIFVYRVSSIYESPPAEVNDQPDFLNQVLEVETWLDPMDLLELCLSIENDLGRLRNKAKGPRNIDIDILLYGGLIIRTETLNIPHIRLEYRPFFLIPLKELLGDVYLTGGNRRISNILGGLSPYDISMYREIS